MHTRRPHLSAWLVAVVVLGTALVALGTWMVVGHRADGGGANEQATLVDRFNDALNAADGSALRSLMTKGVVMVSLGETRVGADAVAKRLIGSSRTGLRVERIAPVTVHGQYATTFVKYTSPGGESGIMLAVFQIRDGKVVRIWGMEPPVTPPFGSSVIG